MLSDHCDRLVAVFQEISVPVTVKHSDDGNRHYEYVAIGNWPKDIDANEMIRRAEVWFEFCDGRLETHPEIDSRYEFWRKLRST